MHDSVWAMLNDTEKAVLRATEPEALDGLDEDELSELHDRVRRARNKYTRLYRRRAAEQVDSDATRGRAHAAHARTLVKAEAFEERLAVVSQHLAKAARASARELKAARVAGARSSGSSGDGAARRASTAKRSGARTKGGARTKDGARPSGTSTRRAPTRTPITKRASASARAAGRRAAAARDAK